jgi:beta-glucosidase-like glycosyl hydrolase
VQFVSAGGDLCLVCHREDYVLQAHEDLMANVEHDKKFAQRVKESVRRVLAFKKKWAKNLRPAKVPSAATIAKLSRRLWEFGEQVRLEPLSRAEDRFSRRGRR